MDKKTLLGFILIGIIFIAFMYVGRPSEAEIEAYNRAQDSIAALSEKKLAEEKQTQTEQAITSLPDSLTTEQKDSMMLLLAANKFGEFASASQGEPQEFKLENDSISISLSSKGAQITNALLKHYKRYDDKPIELIKAEDASLNYTLVTASNRIVETKDLYFKGTQTAPNSVSFTVEALSGTGMEITYTLRDKYLLDIDIKYNNLSSILASNTPYLDASWTLPIYQNEKSGKNEQRYSGLAYKKNGEDTEKLNTGKDVTEDVSGKVQWIAFRDMFFSTIVHSAEHIEQVSLKSQVLSESGILKKLTAGFIVPVSDKNQKLSLFIGPNDYDLLKEVDKAWGGENELAQVIDMGDWFRFINIWLIIPIFNFLETITGNYGIIILLLTLFIKLLLSPFTLKSYMSQAKMRVLRPQVEEINAKYPGDENMMKRQQATMNLYKSAGASTMGGCLPMLLQMPFLIAMYQYFPTSINLRGESFLWAKDLSTYDDIISWSTHIPLISDFIGNHISLFCLLMTVVQIVYMNISQQSTGQASMPGMKMLPYIMSIMFFFFLNQSAAGLSYYYLMSMLITILQTYLFRLFVNEKKLLAKMEENKKKPIKKSKWMQRMEELQKQQMELQKQRRK
ncbi:MAG: membrane protein insertase YidC [Porphyromonas sp.]|nr:membrane protein insertase YidC [Porphyromonas sp.]